MMFPEEISNGVHNLRFNFLKCLPEEVRRCAYSDDHVRNINQ